MPIFNKNNNFNLFWNRVLNKLDIDYLKVSDFKSATKFCITLTLRGVNGGQTSPPPFP